MRSRIQYIYLGEDILKSTSKRTMVVKKEVCRAGGRSERRLFDSTRCQCHLCAQRYCSEILLSRITHRLIKWHFIEVSTTCALNRRLDIKQFSYCYCLGGVSRAPVANGTMTTGISSKQLSSRNLIHLHDSTSNRAATQAKQISTSLSHITTLPRNIFNTCSIILIIIIRC